MKQQTYLGVALIIAAACSGGDGGGPTALESGLASARVTATSISVTALPSLGGSSTARAINDNQVIVGSSNGLPVTWTLVSGTWQVQQLQSTGGAAEDITESGLIVGSSGGSIVLWSGTTSEVVATGFPTAMNESQVIVGEIPSPADGNPARAWTKSGSVWTPHILPRQVGVTDGYYGPTDINDNGVIIGNGGSAAGGGTHPIKWVRNATGEWDPAVPLDNAAAAYLGGAQAIVGPDIVGHLWRCTGSLCVHDPYHWLVTGPGVGTLGSQNAWAEGLNAQRSIVGTFLYRGTHAFVWTPANPTIRDLGAPKGYQSAQAHDINNPTLTRAMQAVGEAIPNRGAHIAVLWTVPVP
jgi:hypothetical protein